MTEKQFGIAGTVLVHNVLILILLFSLIRMPEPLPSEGGLIINFGDVPVAGGISEPDQNNAPAMQEDRKQAETDPDDGLMTQDFEEAPVIKKPAEKKQTEQKKPEPKPVEKPVEKTPKPVEKPKTVNTKALYSNRGQSASEKGSNEGLYTGKGNQGDPAGSPDSDNYSKGLGGSGMAFSLAGRLPVHLQKPEFSIQKEGLVVVEIVVDRTGRVTSATPGVKGSTLVDNTLYAAAKKAAMESKFNLKEDAPERQAGTITYHFKLQ